MAENGTSGEGRAPPVSRAPGKRGRDCPRQTGTGAARDGQTDGGAETGERERKEGEPTGGKTGTGAARDGQTGAGVPPANRRGRTGGARPSPAVSERHSMGFSQRFRARKRGGNPPQSINARSGSSAYSAVALPLFGMNTETSRPKPPPTLRSHPCVALSSGG